MARTKQTARQSTYGRRIAPDSVSTSRNDHTVFNDVLSQIRRFRFESDSGSCIALSDEEDDEDGDEGDKWTDDDLCDHDDDDDNDNDNEESSSTSTLPFPKAGVQLSVITALLEAYKDQEFDCPSMLYALISLFLERISSNDATLDPIIMCLDV